EHGVGALKVRQLQQYQSPVALGLMRTLKRALDPQNLLNPGRVLG
ncbi:MAG: FAD-binding oxidoreductase, partial [Burkholderiaceae bacterium]